MISKVIFKLCLVFILISINITYMALNKVYQTSKIFRANFIETESTGNGTVLNLATIIAPSENENRKINKVTDINFTLKNPIQKKQTFADCLNSTNRMIPTEYRILPKRCTNEIDLLWLIKSSISRNSLRKIIRLTWGQEFIGNENVSSPIKSVRRIFVLGSDADNEISPLLIRESEMFQDILQGSFPDTYASATQKVLMGLKFITEFCKPKLIAVVDDDAVVSPWNLFHLLPAKPVSVYYSGFFVPHWAPIRETKHRWGHSMSEYSCAFYPEFACGTLFVLSYPTALTLIMAAPNYPYFSMDDVFLGGLAQDIGIPKTYFSLHQYTEYDYLMQQHSVKSVKQLIVCHGADNAKQQKILWSEFCYSATSHKDIYDVILTYCKNVLN